MPTFPRVAAILLACGHFLTLAAHADALVPFPPQPPGVPFPVPEWSEAVPGDPSRERLRAVAARSLDNPAETALARTRALVVVHGGRLVLEWYASGISERTRLQSWSMAKSMLHAALGIAMADRRLAAGDAANVPEWRGDGDPRARITLLQLAQMTDGLRFDEDYANPQSHVMQMLFGAGRGDVGASAARASLAHMPGTRWSYSSGSANLLSRKLRDALGGREAYAAFLRGRLFARIGMNSAVAEFDAAGTWIGSSYVHATARDYARFGLLYLRGGNWNGEQVVPRAWVERARTPTMASRGEYGALFWLNARDPDTGKPAISEKLPDDLFLARGFGGQIIAIIPSQDVVLVMLNVNYSDDATAIIDLVARLLNALPRPSR